MVGCEDESGTAGLHRLHEPANLAANEFAVVTLDNPLVEAPDEDQFLAIALGILQHVVPCRNLHWIEPVETCLDDERKGFPGAPTAVENDGQAVGMEELDDLAVVGEDQFGEDPRRGEQALVVAQVLVHPHPVGNSGLLEEHAVVGLVEVGVDPVVVVNPRGVEQEALVKGDVAH